MRIPTRLRLVLALALPAALVSMPQSSLPANAAPEDDTAVHRSVPLTVASEATARLLPGATGSESSSSSAAAEPTRTSLLALDEGVHVLGLRWEGGEPQTAELRVRGPGSTWGAWTPLEDAVPTAPADAATPDLMDTAATDASGQPVGGGDAVVRATTGDVVVGPAEVEVRLVAEADDATLETWSTSTTATDVATVGNLPITTDDLVIGTRADWGVDESAPRVTRPFDLVNTTPKLGVTVHHTAGTNDYSAEQVPAIIRGIFYYHGQTLKWDDIGYAALVDKYGRVWEGRAGGVEENVQLAHAFGMNRDWTGIAVLGNHESAQVWATELRALSELTAWTLKTHGVSPGSTVSYRNPYEGWTRTLNVVHAHRDVGQTLCPGFNLYALMDLLRTWVVTDYAESSDAVQRIGGENRYAVSARMAQEAYLGGTRSAYLVSGVALPDALGVGAVADAAGAAVLLTRPDGVPEETWATLKRLRVRSVTLVGGEAAIPESIADELSAAGYTVSRVAGPNRYGTAAELATQGTMPGRTVYVANGVSLVDALGGASAAAEQGGAVVLAARSALPAATAEALQALTPSRVVILGGTAAVSTKVQEQLAALLPSSQIDRVGGRNRYATSALLAGQTFSTARSAVVASGTAPVDAMVGTQLAARHDGPVLLVRPDCRPTDVDATYRSLGITLSRLAGGTGVLDWSAGSRVCRP